MTGGHGHVVPRADGMKARCGGPGICSECAAELGAQNTDRELYREPAEPGLEYYAPSIHVTQEGAIGIDVGGTVFVRSLRAWHAAMSPWRPIETAPKDDSLFLAWVPDGRTMIWSGRLLQRALGPGPDHLRFPATHWMPLPEPPGNSPVKLV